MVRGKLAIIKLYIVSMGTMAKIVLGGRKGTIELNNYGLCAYMPTYVYVRTDLI